MIVAKIDKDYFADESQYQNPLMMSQVGVEFDYESMENWWGWGRTKDDGLPTEQELTTNGYTRFKLYDGDDELYYEGWLFNDTGCFVQQFVLRWAEADSSCTTIEVLLDGKWVQEIG